MENKQNKGGGLNKSLKLIFVYTVATGSIFTFVNYWDSVFYGYCGSGTFLAFALMTVAILPVALVYSELASLFHTSGGELIYNTVQIFWLHLIEVHFLPAYISKDTFSI